MMSRSYTFKRTRHSLGVVGSISYLSLVMTVGVCFFMVIGGVGCSALMHPGASTILKKAQEGTGNDGVQTLINLTTMMEGTIPAVKTASGHQQELDTLHDQFHALDKAFCDVTDVQGKHPAYIKAHTLKKEMRTVFHRLWKFRERAPLREAHLDLFSTRVTELQEALRAITP